MPIKKFGGRPMLAASSAAVLRITGGLNGELPLESGLPLLPGLPLPLLLGLPPLPEVSPLLGLPLLLALAPPLLARLLGVELPQLRHNPNAVPSARHGENLIISLS
jgi:hypothetical protein